MNREVIAALKRIHDRSEAQRRREVREHRVVWFRVRGSARNWIARCLDFGGWRA